MTQPRIYLAIDNCFASKRWCEPAAWMDVVKELGVAYVEASADNEIDPYFATPAFLDTWIADVARESRRKGVTVANCYSGHGTYATLGLGHYDAGMRRHMQEDWMAAMMCTAGRLGAGLGFFAHAFSEKVLADRGLYAAAYDDLIRTFRSLAVTAAEAGVKTYGVEQMYSPHQVPWTLAGTDDFLKRTNVKEGGLPVYITLDTGHQSGQRRFQVPSDEAIAAFGRDIREGRPSAIYLGPRENYEVFRDMAAKKASDKDLTSAIKTYAEENSHLFSRYEDGDTYAWLKRFACYSPIIHLQQTDGNESSHKNFTPALNAWGIINGPDVLRAAKASCDLPSKPGLPTRVNELWFTLEPFLATACHPRVMLEDIAASVKYWRQYIPEDGMTLDEAVGALKA